MVRAFTCKMPLRICAATVVAAVDPTGPNIFRSSLRLWYGNLAKHLYPFTNIT
jgi:hypothetical protein